MTENEMNGNKKTVREGIDTRSMDFAPLKMPYTLYYQKRYGDAVVISRSKSLLKLLKIKLVTYGYNTCAFIAAGREQFDKFDLSYDERAQYNDFEMKVNAGWYFPLYDARKIVLKHYKKEI